MSLLQVCSCKGAKGIILDGNPISLATSKLLMEKSVNRSGDPSRNEWGGKLKFWPNQAGFFNKEENVNLRKLVYRLCNIATVFTKTKKTKVVADTGLSLEEYTHLVSKSLLVVKVDSGCRTHPLAMLVNSALVTILPTLEQTTTKIVSLPGPLKFLVQSLVSDHCTSALLPFSCVDHLKSLLHDFALPEFKFSPSNPSWKHLAMYAPLVAEAISCLTSGCRKPKEITLPWSTLLNKMISIVAAPSGAGSKIKLTGPSTLDNDSTMLETGVFTTLPRFSLEIPRYNQDENTACFKQGKQVGVQSAGMMAAVCAEHGNFLYFSLMNSSESPRTVFDLLLSRFWDRLDVSNNNRGTFLTIYDNACNAHRYCYSREPQIFREAKFVLDRLHASGHCKCARSFHPDSHHLLLSQATTNNTQRCEQLNSELRHLKVQIRHMSQMMAMIHIRYFLWNRHEASTRLA